MAHRHPLPHVQRIPAREALRKRFAAVTFFSFERSKKGLDTFPQLIRHIAKGCLSAS